MTRLRIPDGTREQLPVMVTLLGWDDVRPGPALTCLVAILVNAELGPEGRDPQQRVRVVELARMVRNAIEQPKAQLRALVAGAASVTGLLRHIDDQIAGGNGLHVTFEGLWGRWLRHRVIRWIMGEPGRLSRALVPPRTLLPDIESPDLPIWGSPGAEGDDQLEMSSIEVGGADFDRLSQRATHALATAYQLSRRSGEAGLSLPPDHFVPDGLICAIAQSSLRVGQAALAAGQAGRAERFFGLGLLIASGLREIDLEGLRWGSENEEGDAFVCIETPMISLRLKRPPGAVSPPIALLPDLERVTDRICWPLPPSLHQALKSLAPSPWPTAGSPVLPEKAGRLGGEYRLSEVVAEISHSVHLGASRFRLALAANLTGKFGPESTQLMMRDTFSTSLGPAYYGSLPEHALMEEVARLLTRWFGEQVRAVEGRTARVGSRLVPSENLAREWPKRLIKEAYSAARKKDGWREHLIAERNHLAGALCAATGNRPGGSLGELRLDSVIPEYGLVVLEDKQADLLRRTRIAATGSLWTTALRHYLDRLLELSSHEVQEIAAWAASVLRSESPLFSAPGQGGNVVRLDVASILKVMPPSLAGVANHYRHRLNQCLQAREVDWELRHAQLGWVVSPAFALADLSPLSARLLGERLAPVIDEILTADGWYTRSQRISRWSWGGIPDRPLKDWAAETTAYEQEHGAHVRCVREMFKERRREIEREILPRLAIAVSELVPALRVDVEHRVLEIAAGFRSDGPVNLSMDHYALIRDRMRRDAGDPSSAMEAVVVEYLIHALVMKAIANRIVAGPEPTRRHLGVTAELSPFLPGIGLAVRHSEVIRRRLGEVASRNNAHDRPGIVQLSTLANTPYRSLEAAAAAVASVSKAIRGSGTNEWLRIPATRDRKEVPMVFAGAVATTLARRGQEAPSAKPLSQDDFARWIQKRFGDALGCAESDNELVVRVVGTLRASGRLELSGPERLVMQGQPLAAVGTQRALALADGWPLQTSPEEFVDDAGPEELRERSPKVDEGHANANRAAYRRLTSALNPTVSRRAESRDGKRAWRNRLEKDLVQLEKEVGSNSNLGLITGYMAHRLRYGGRKRAELSQGSLHKETTRFGGALLEVLGTRSLLKLESEDLQAIYLAVLCRKGANARAEVLEELQRFHRYLETVHHAADVEFAKLYSFAGPRVRTSDAGALSDVEIRRVLQELLDDLDREKAQQNAGPDAIRACALRVLMFLVLEGSGVRPGSAYGLVLGDIHLLGADQDFVHVHRVGDYGEAKTTTSVGFVRLEGSLWNDYRQWAIDWINCEKDLIGDARGRHPVFAESAGSRRRFASRYLTRRVDMLLKWVSSQPRARTYWLRKNRVTKRVGSAFRHPQSTARAVLGALRESGHVGILTPMTHYIHDITVPLATYLRHADRPNRKAVLEMTALPAAPLDAIWHRNRKEGEVGFHEVVLDRLGAHVASPPKERLTSPPVLYRQQAITPRHIDAFAREMHRHGSQREAMARSGLTDVQVDVLERAIEELVIRKGAAPWHIPEMRTVRAAMQPARSLAGCEALFRLLDDAHCDWLVILAKAWAEQGHIPRLHDRSVVLVLRDEQQWSAASTLLIETKIDLQLARANSGGGILHDQNESSRSSHGSALRWVLALAWMHDRLVATKEAGS